jgi:hypothetical protein
LKPPPQTEVREGGSLLVGFREPTLPAARS